MSASDSSANDSSPSNVAREPRQTSIPTMLVTVAGCPSLDFLVRHDHLGCCAATLETNSHLFWSRLLSFNVPGEAQSLRSLNDLEYPHYPDDRLACEFRRLFSHPRLNGLDDLAAPLKRTLTCHGLVIRRHRTFTTV
jgi:hypothetical protein